MDERDWYLALGIQPPEDEGANESDPAEPTEPAGQEPGEAAEPTVEETPADVEDGSADVDEGEEEREPAEPAAEEADHDTPEQSREERARQAAARRKREQDAAVDAAVQAERERTAGEIREIFQWAGFKDGTAPIESLEQMRQYIERTEAGKLEEELRQGRLTPDRLKAMVQNELKAQQAPAPETAQVDPAEFERQVQAELTEIRRYDPSIQSVEDFRNLDRADAFFAEITQHGHSFAEAYRYVYADKIAGQNARKAAAAGAQRAMNSARSKEHLRPDGAKGAGDVPVPPETMRYYRALMPGMTDEEIRKDFNKYEKQQK